jgi:hypothetical protein
MKYPIIGNPHFKSRTPKRGKLKLVTSNYIEASLQPKVYLELTRVEAEMISQQLALLPTSIAHSRVKLKTALAILNPIDDEDFGFFL